MYLQTKDSFTPVACDRDIGFQSQTDPEKLMRHERGMHHRKGVARMGLPDMPGVQVVTVGGAGADKSQPDQPVVPVASNRCLGVCSENRLLHSYGENFHAGQPSTNRADGESDP